MSTTLCPILLTALFKIELLVAWTKSDGLVVILKFVLPTTKVTLSVIDLSVATASSCVTFSKFRSPFFVQDQNKRSLSFYTYSIKEQYNSVRAYIHDLQCEQQSIYRQWIGDHQRLPHRRPLFWLHIFHYHQEYADYQCHQQSKSPILYFLSLNQFQLVLARLAHAYASHLV